MKIKNFNFVIVLIAEILVAVYGYLFQYSLPKLVVTMAVVFVVFFLIGTILQALSNRILAQVEAKEIREREEERIAEELRQQREEETIEE